MWTSGDLGVHGNLAILKRSCFYVEGTCVNTGGLLTQHGRLEVFVEVNGSVRTYSKLSRVRQFALM